MAIKSWRRKQLRKPDEFVSFWTRVWAVLRENRLPLIFGLAAAVVVGSGVAVWTHFSTKRHEAATMDLTQALKTYAAPLLAKDDVEETSTDNSDRDVPRFHSAKERAEATLKSLDALGKASGGAALAKEGLPLRATALLDLDRVDEALTTYRKFLSETSDRDPLIAFAHEGLGYALERKGDLARAREEFRAMAPGENSPQRDRALWHEARLLQKMGKKDDAKKALQMIVEKFAESTLRDDVQARLAALNE